MQRGRGQRSAAVLAAAALGVAGCAAGDEGPDAAQVEGLGEDPAPDAAGDASPEAGDDGEGDGQAPIVADETVDLAEVGSFTLDATSGPGSWRVVNSDGNVDVAYLVPDVDAAVTLFLPPPPADDRWTEQAIAGSGGDALDQAEVLVRIEDGEELELVFEPAGG